MDDLASPMNIPPKFPTVCVTHVTSQYKHHVRAYDPRLTNKLRDWPLEGKYFRSTPAHILAANAAT